MRQRIRYGKNTPLTFQENLVFDRECPYTVRLKKFLNEDIAPMHYASTLEILIFSNARGVAKIEDTPIEIAGNKAICIPPYTVHSTAMHISDGQVYVIHISLEAMKHFLDIESLLEAAGVSPSAAEYVVPQYEALRQMVDDLVRCDEDAFARTRIILQMIETIYKNARKNPGAAIHANSYQSDELKHLIKWTADNFTTKISVQQAAAYIGFSSSYFCTWFKRQTGMTYNSYVNDIRISNACQLLAKTASIQNACFSSGFTNLSYFVQLFKRIQGCTPKQYMLNLNKDQ